MEIRTRRRGVYPALGLLATIVVCAAAPGAGASVASPAPEPSAATTAAVTTATVTTATPAAQASPPVTPSTPVTPSAPVASPTSRPSSPTICPTYSPTPVVPGQVVARHDFEDGGHDRWTATGVTGMSTAPEAARTGERGLRVDGVDLDSRISLLLPAGVFPEAAQYTLTVRARVAPGSPATSLNVHTAAPSMIPDFAPVTAGEWTTLTSPFYPPLIAVDFLCDDRLSGYVRPAAVTAVIIIDRRCVGEDPAPTTLYLDDVEVTAVRRGTGTLPTPMMPPTCLHELPLP